MFCSFNEFKAWCDKTNEIFKKFDDSVSYFVSRTRGPTYSGIISSATAHHRTNFFHIPLKNRIDQLYKIRELHQKLKSVIEEIINRSSDKGFLSTSDIENGYNSFKGINVLDTSKEGNDALERC